jgi:hypothetical protein
MPTSTPLDMPSPSGEELKAARLAAGLSQVQAAELMGYSVQAGSRGGLQSRTWQAMESPSGDRNMQGPVFAMFLLLTGTHPVYQLIPQSAPQAEPARISGVKPVQLPGNDVVVQPEHRPARR